MSRPCALWAGIFLMTRLGCERFTLDLLERGVLNIGHALRDAVVIAQVDEHELAVVAPTVDPSGQANGLPDMCFTECGASMRAVTVHGSGSALLNYEMWMQRISALV